MIAFDWQNCATGRVCHTLVEEYWFCVVWAQAEGIGSPGCLSLHELLFFLFLPCRNVSWASQMPESEWRVFKVLQLVWNTAAAGRRARSESTNHRCSFCCDTLSRIQISITADRLDFDRVSIKVKVTPCYQVFVKLSSQKKWSADFHNLGICEKGLFWLNAINDGPEVVVPLRPSS